MTRRIICLCITLFWLMMMGLLFKDQIIPRYFGIIRLSYKDLVPRQLLLKDEWMGIYFNNSKIGYSNTYMSVKDKDKISGYSIQNETSMFLPLLGGLHRIHFKGVSFVDSDGKLIDFDFFLKSDKGIFQVTGARINEKTLQLDIHSPDQSARRSIPLPEGCVLYSPLVPLDILKNLRKNKRFFIDFFNPLSLTNEKVNFLVKDKTIIDFGGIDSEAYLVQIDYRGLLTHAWVSPSGKLLKQESALGWTIVSESPQEAISNISLDSIKSVDLLSAFSIASNLVIAQPEKIKFLKIRLEGINFPLEDLEDNRQKLVKEKDLKFLVINSSGVPKQKILSLPINTKGMEEYLVSSDFVQSNDREIIRQAREIAGSQTDALKAALLINNWVYKNIKKFPTISIPSSIEVLHTREGDCNEHSYLFVALARAIGLPAKILVGLVYEDTRFFYHAWPAVFVGEWLSLDPTFGQDNADATHIRIFEGELNQQLNLASILGKIKIHIEEYR